MEKARVAVDVVIFTIQNSRLQVLLVQRAIPPFKGQWAIPGGFVLEKESLEIAARRELLEEAGVRDIYLEQLFSWGDPDRDPRGRVISVSYFALVSEERSAVRAGSDAAEAGWFPAHRPPKLAFDHRKILDYAMQRLRWKFEWTTVGFELLPKKFTLTELQRVYEAVLDKPLDKRNFRRKVGQLDILKPLKEHKKDGVQRPARLYTFSAKKFEKLWEKGILFPF